LFGFFRRWEHGDSRPLGLLWSTWKSGCASKQPPWAVPVLRLHCLESTRRIDADLQLKGVLPRRTAATVLQFYS
jgi:hypothetical protein